MLSAASATEALWLLGWVRPTIIVVDVPPDAGAVLRAEFDAHVVRPLDPWELCAVVAGAAQRLS